MFHYKLALAAGRVDVDRMVSEMTPEEMDGWIAYDRISPIGTEKVCWTIARGFAVLINAVYILCRWVGVKDLKNAHPNDFIPWKKSKPRKSKDTYLNPNAMVQAVRLAVNK